MVPPLAGGYHGRAGIIVRSHPPCRHAGRLEPTVHAHPGEGVGLVPPDRNRVHPEIDVHWREPRHRLPRAEEIVRRSAPRRA